jgi:hypothetical protein
MTVVPITHRIRNKFGYIGLVCGMYAGFLLRGNILLL